MALSIGEEFRAQFAHEFRKLVADLQDAPGETADERLSSMLADRGWDQKLDALRDDPTLHAFVIEAMKRLAVRGKRSDSRATADEIERAKRREETERIAASGVMGDLYTADLVGFDTDALVGKLPRETYWVPSLQRDVPRAELAASLALLAELRDLTIAEIRARDAVTHVYKVELGIFVELIDRAASAHRPAGVAEFA
jgi:hypothetical protein